MKAQSHQLRTTNRVIFGMMVIMKGVNDNVLKDMAVYNSIWKFSTLQESVSNTVLENCIILYMHKHTETLLCL